MGELGFLGVIIPEEYGGAGLDYTCAGPAHRGGRRGRRRHVHRRRGAELGLGAAPIAAVRHARSRRSATCRGLAAGELLGAYALTEPDAGSDTANDPHPRHAERRRLAHRRRQAVDHQRRLRRLLHPLRAHRRAGREGRLRVPRRARRRASPSDARSRSWACTPRPRSSWPSTASACRASDLIGEEGEGLKIALATLDSRPHHDRRPGLRHRPRGRSSWPSATRASGTAFGGADRALPGRPVPDRRGRRPARRGAPADAPRRRACATPASRTRRRARKAKLVASRVAVDAADTWPSRRSAATATRPSSRPSASTATRRSPRSTRAPARSSAS